MMMCSRSAIAEQPRLGLAVGLHRGVIVQMVAAQVGERGRVEAHAVDPALIERMRGHLHRDHRARRASADCASVRCTLMASGVVWVGASSAPMRPQPIVPM